MILLLQSKEYIFSKIKRKLDQEPYGHYINFSGFTSARRNAFFIEDKRDILLRELTSVITLHDNDEDISRYQSMDVVGAKLLAIDRYYGTQFFINSYEYKKNGIKINVDDLLSYFETEFNKLKESANKSFG